MRKRPVLLGVCALIAALASVHPGNPAMASNAAPKRPGIVDAPYGMAVTPAVYFVNFLLLYISNPDQASYMPAYRATIPSALDACLEEHPMGCPYDEFARFFDDRTTGNRRCDWPPECQLDARWERLAPSVARRPDQINEPLGKARAARLARSLGIDKRMILTPDEYQCTIGSAPRTGDQETIFSCIENLTNSKGATHIPLSSYGLALTEEGDVQSVCAPEAPCLVFNQLFDGPLEKIAAGCGWARKLERMVRKTPFMDFVVAGNTCQQWGGAGTGPCLAPPVCPDAHDER